LIPEPIFLNPVLKNYIWGGTKLHELFDKESDTPNVAESWELSCNTDGLSTISMAKKMSWELFAKIQKAFRL